jgi:hypothetical protein
MQFRAVVRGITLEMPATGNRADPNRKLPWIRIEDQTAEPPLRAEIFQDAPVPTAGRPRRDDKYFSCLTRRVHQLFTEIRRPIRRLVRDVGYFDRRPPGELQQDGRDSYPVGLPAIASRSPGNLQRQPA